jgi:hypothetical protein
MTKHIYKRMTTEDQAKAKELTACLKLAKSKLSYAKAHYHHSESEIWGVVIAVVDQSYTALVKKYLNK